MATATGNTSNTRSTAKATPKAKSTTKAKVTPAVTVKPAKADIANGDAARLAWVTIHKNRLEKRNGFLKELKDMGYTETVSDSLSLNKVEALVNQVRETAKPKKAPAKKRAPKKVTPTTETATA